MRRFLPAAALLCVAALLLPGGCSRRRLYEGAVPFPAKVPVFTDDEGRALAGLPDAPEPLRLVVLDFPWCPPCADVWKAVAEVSRSTPAGSVRVFRILFDRERFFTRDGVAQALPLRAVPPPDAGSFPVVTLTALPDAFREQFRLEQAPLVLLADRRGRILRRWTGHGPNFPASLAEEIRRRLERR